MQEFSEILQRAAGLLAVRPLRRTLTETEISRIAAEFHYAEMLAEDEAFTVEGAAEHEAFTRSIAKQLAEAGIEFGMSFPLDAQGPPTYGLSNRQLSKRADYLEDELPAMRAALARGDISTVAELLTELLDRFHLNLDTQSAAYRKLGFAVLRADVRALEALQRRSKGEPIEPAAQTLLQGATGCGDSLGAITAKLLRLLDHHGAAELDVAIREAPERGVPHPNAVRLALERRREQLNEAPPVAVELPDHVKTRDAVVRPHRLNAAA